MTVQQENNAEKRRIHRVRFLDFVPCWFSTWLSVNAHVSGPQ